jgi:hypothetical protein
MEVKITAAEIKADFNIVLNNKRRGRISPPVFIRT